MDAIRYIAWFLIDMTLKFVIGFGIVMVVWCVAVQFVELSPRPWMIGSAVFGACLNGFFELCDVFGIKFLIGISED